MKQHARNVLVAIAILLTASHAHAEKCPHFPVTTNYSCPCYNFEDGIFLECSEITIESLQLLLNVITSPIQSLSIYDLDRSVTELKPVFTNKTIIKHLQISQSNLRTLNEGTLVYIRDYLESLSLVSGKLQEIPQKAFSGLIKLISLDLEGNEIKDLPSYCFYGLNLIKIGMKGNHVEKMSEYAFAGLEDTLSELDLSENKLNAFPLLSIRRLERLRALRLAWNQIADIPFDEYFVLKSLEYLDLSSNNFEAIADTCLRAFPYVKTLSLHYNSIDSIGYQAFETLANLESVDLSYNKLIYLDARLFDGKKRLKTVDLSHNHIHYINGLFINLPELREVFLSENNLLEIPSYAFYNSSLITDLYLSQNSIRKISDSSFAGLINLVQLHLSSNFIRRVSRTTFQDNHLLTTLCLDQNAIDELDQGVFAKNTQIKEIQLQNNRITNITRGVFEPLSNLVELQLQDNRINHIESRSFTSLKSLQHINLQGNEISNFEDVFAHDAAIVSIHLNHNRISNIMNETFRGQSNVQIIWLGHNRLTKIDKSLFIDLIAIKRLYLNNNTVSIIENHAFESLATLNYLDLSYNHLEYINITTFADLLELEEINLSNNRLLTIEGKSLDHLKKIRKIDLSNNFLRTIHKTMFQERLPIRYLYLRNASIETIESSAFDGLNNLYELDLRDNFIKQTDLKSIDIPGLRILKLSGNDFNELTINFQSLPSLQTITLDFCNINEISGLKSKNLQKIDLSNNVLSTLNTDLFKNLNHLKEINLDRNQFNDLPYQAIGNLTQLETLTIASNRIDQIDFAQLAHLYNMKQLDVSGNRLSAITGVQKLNLTQIITIDLSGNQLSNLPKNFFKNSPSLNHLDLSSNRFKQIPFVSESLPKLTWLNISSNPLLEIHGTMDNFTSLEEIHVKHANLSIITSKDFNIFPSLLYLYLSHNNILRISPGAFKSLSNLLTLDVSVNEIELMPQERFNGLNALKLLNLSHNNLRDLEVFPNDLQILHILDLSFNKITRISKPTFGNLAQLVELYLFGNWISMVSGDAFKPLKKLVVLDLSRNYLENIPLNAFRPLETQIRSLKAEENPIFCDCDSQELWEWLQDHQKLIGTNTLYGLRCEQPSELRGRVFLDLNPQQFCNVSLIVKLAIQDIQPYSVHVSWQSRNYSALHTYQVVYYPLDTFYEIQILTKPLDRNSRSTKIDRLIPNTKYLICVISLGSWLTTPSEQTFTSFYKYDDYLDDLEDSVKLLSDDVKPYLVDSPTSKCTDVITLDIINAHYIEDNSNTMDLEAILTRRLGLIIGCCLGFVVFIVLITVLGYLKMKKHTVVQKPPAPVIPPEYLSYRHFSIQSGEAQERHHVASGPNSGPNGGHPHFIMAPEASS